jgi:hypothetical protein
MDRAERPRLIPWLVLLLLLANLAIAGYIFLQSGRGEGMRGHEPFNAEQIRILEPSAAGTEGSPEAQAQRAALCLEWGVLAAADVERARARLVALNLAEKVTLRTIPQPVWWVYIPPLPNRQAAVAKLGELRALGLTDSDFSLMEEEGPYRNAVSLGLFSTEEAARSRLQALAARGVRSATVGSRPGGKNGTLFVIADLDEQAMSQLLTLKQQFPGTDVKAAPCAAGDS